MGGHDSWHPGCSLAALESFRQVVYSSCPVTILPSRHKPGAVHPFAAATTAQLMFHSGIIVHQAFQMLLAQAASDQAGLLSEHEGGARQGCSIGRLERIIQPDKSSDVTVSVFFSERGFRVCKNVDSEVRTHDTHLHPCLEPLDLDVLPPSSSTSLLFETTSWVTVQSKSHPHPSFCIARCFWIGLLTLLVGGCLGRSRNASVTQRRQEARQSRKRRSTRRLRTSCA